MDLLQEGTRVQKIGSKPGDAHQDGALATVLNGLEKNGLVGYFVEWDDYPGIPCFVAGYRVKELE
jgi:hypothetical protein